MLVALGDRAPLEHSLGFSRSSLLTIAYITIIYERAMGRGEGWVEVPFIPPGWECA